MKFPQVEKAIREGHLKNCDCVACCQRLKGAELTLSALGEEPPTLTEEQAKEVIKKCGIITSPVIVKQVVTEAFRLVFRSEPEIPELTPFLSDMRDKFVHLTGDEFNERARGIFNAGVELGKRGGK